VSLLDGQGNVVQCGAFVFTGSGSQDLSNASQILPPFNLGFHVTTMQYLPCNPPPRLPNNVFTAPGPVIAVAYNGVLLGPDYYSILGNQITLTFTTELGDRIDAFCIVSGTTSTSSSGAVAPVIPGSAVSSGILDNSSTWIGVHDSGTPGTASGTSTYISPTVGRRFNFAYTGNGGLRYSIDFAVDTSSQNYCYDLEVAFTDPSQVLNMELDFNQAMSDGRTVIFDCQCASVSNRWEYNSWQTSMIVGNPQTWGVSTYRHIRIFWHRDATGNITTWDGVEFDGVYKPFSQPTPPTANTAQSLGWAVGHLVINFQIEGSSAGSGTVDAYGRNITVWRW
jgi:hypothetical protein